ncbi:hypothetical protein KDX27_07695 [Burkholderia cenocepacia]|uniref:hypothetical protein n=1 Tax=Burkholderia cenocepacia TaxID=95486 RepID=UPI001B8E8974|nr:hypothetical protein [Burkholderia cenocepacia]MBR8023779.1 hypothetical protein [Burkholderia cenocepacia]MBR8167593.1 hypothetical protein [Burkholderia cenocepacia]MBR8422276.1 hypothetical protein [Burkholderia cenocepacia]MCW5148233.1 hypothetical protein [Burkholderia cenocepacia]
MVLHRVVKDHSDIKNPAMMQRADSVWNLKESGIIRAARASSVMPRRIFCFSSTTRKPFPSWTSAFKAFKSTGLFFHFYYHRSINAMRRHARVIRRFDSLQSRFNRSIAVRCAIHKIPIRLILHGIIYPAFKRCSRTSDDVRYCLPHVVRRQDSNRDYFPPPGSAISISTGS